jgi:hypothetical protein
VGREGEVGIPVRDALDPTHHRDEEEQPADGVLPLPRGDQRAEDAERDRDVERRQFGVEQSVERRRVGDREDDGRNAGQRGEHARRHSQRAKAHAARSGGAHAGAVPMRDAPTAVWRPFTSAGSSRSQPGFVLSAS